MMGLPTRLRLARVGVLTDLGPASTWARWCAAVFRAGAQLLLIRDTGDRLPMDEALTTARRAAVAHRGLVGVINPRTPGLRSDVVHVARMEAGTPGDGRTLIGCHASTQAEFTALMGDPRVSFVTVTAPWWLSGGAAPGTGSVADSGVRLDGRPWLPPKPWFLARDFAPGEIQRVLTSGVRRVIVGAHALDLEQLTAVSTAVRGAWNADAAERRTPRQNLPPKGL